MNPYQTLKHPVSTEKTIRLMESENKLVFIVDRKSRKSDIKEAFKEAFGTKPLAVSTHIRGKDKIAYIKLATDVPAIDIATQLGLM